MIYIERRRGKPLSWGMRSEGVFPSVRPNDVVALTADGDELRAILLEFDNIPRTAATTQVWVGVFAQQIFVNLNAVLAVIGQDVACGVGPAET